MIFINLPVVFLTLLYQTSSMRFDFEEFHYFVSPFPIKLNNFSLICLFSPFKRSIHLVKLVVTISNRFQIILEYL